MKAFSEKELIKVYKTLTEEDRIALSEELLQRVPVGSEKKAKRKNLTHKATGKLYFEYDPEDEVPKPIHNIDVELWDRDVTNPDDFLGSGITGPDGTFEILYDPADAGKMDLPDLELRIYEYQHKFDKHGNIRERKKLLYAIKGDDNVTIEHYDFGICKIPYWEYDPESVTPRVLITEEGEAPQSYAPGRSLLMVKVLASVELKKRKHLAMANHISVEEVQEAYPENLTRLMEKDNPGSSRSDEFFVECLLNGMSANIMDRDPADPDLLWIHYHWNSYEQDGVYAMPNIDVKLKIEKDKLTPVSITVGLRKQGEKLANSPIEKTTVYPDEGDRWQQAKRIARVSSALIAELDMHLCSTHLNVEQYAIAAYRNIRKNPIRYLLFPHIKEVALINNSANKLLLGKTGYVTRATGFTEKSLYERIRQVVGTLDWKNWKPRRKIYTGHIYASASQLYWEVLNEYIDWFFEFYNEEIRNQWLEIKLFSDELVDRSVPVFMCNYLDQTLPESGALGKTPENGMRKLNDNSWYDWNERMDISISRPVINNVHKSISRITESDKASDADILNLKQVCAYVIHHATFVHWWSNSRQYAEGGELRFTGLGLRYGDNGLFTSENDDSVLPPPEDATMQLWISYMLSNSNFGYILKNEEKDIHPRLLELLKKRRKDFQKLGVNIEDIPSRTNI